MRCFLTPTCRVLVVLAFGLCLSALVGCSNSPVSGPSGSVSGKVTYNGSPVPAGCTVLFMHQEKSLPASGVTAADGSYKLLTAGQPKVPVGTYKVTISAPGKETKIEADPKAYEAMMTGKGKTAEEKPPFPKKYQAADTSGLTFTVKEGSNTFDIEMKD